MINKDKASRSSLGTEDDVSTGNEALNMLKEIFENINRWLQFAEAKHGALIGINGLFLFKSVDYIFGLLEEVGVNVLILWLMTAVFFSAILISLKSFFPNTDVCKDKVNSSDDDDSHSDRVLVFYEDIRKYESSLLYLRDIYKHYLGTKININDLKKIEVDYAKEIFTNSKITSYKYKYFKLAVKLNIMAIIIFIVFLITSIKQ